MDRVPFASIQVVQNRHPLLHIPTPTKRGVVEEFIGETREERVMRDPLVVVHLVMVMSISRMGTIVFFLAAIVASAV